MKLSLGLSPRDYSVAGGSVAYDTDAQAYFTVNTAITSAADKTAINTFYLGLKSDGIYTKIKAMYLPIWGSAANCKWNLINNRSYDLTFGTGWTFSSGGMTPLNTYADTNLNTNSVFTVDNNSHLSFYSRTNISQVSVDIGNKTSAPSNIYNLLSIRRSDISNTTYYGINTVTGFASFVDSNSSAFYINTRIGNTTNGFRNNVKQATNISSPSARPNLNIVLSALNEGGSILAGYYSTKQCSLASIGDGLTDTEATNFYNRVQTLMTYFGINV